MNLKFSVVTVVFNASIVIEKTMESVLNQTYKPYEYIVIDGKSSDNTLEIVNNYRKKFINNNINFIVISEKDSGIYNAMNKGIKIATGDFISFLNAGDWYEHDALEKINSFYNEDSFDLTYGSLNYVKPNGDVIIKKSKLDKWIISSRNWNHPSMFLRNDKYKKYYFDEHFKAYADFDLYLKLRKDGTKIRVIDKVITNFVADGVSTNTCFDKVLKRAKEKYDAYSHNDYGFIYLFESYGWECVKALYFRLNG